MPLVDNKAKDEVEENIIETIEKIRPFLQRDGGDISFDHYDKDTGTVFVKVIGACMGCLYLGPEITEGVTTILQDEVPEVNTVQILEATEEELKEYGLYPPNPFEEFPPSPVLGGGSLPDEKENSKSK